MEYLPLPHIHRDPRNTLEDGQGKASQWGADWRDYRTYEKRYHGKVLYDVWASLVEEGITLEWEGRKVDSRIWREHPLDALFMEVPSKSLHTPVRVQGRTRQALDDGCKSPFHRLHRVYKELRSALELIIHMLSLSAIRLTYSLFQSAKHFAMRLTGSLNLLLLSDDWRL